MPDALSAQNLFFDLRTDRLVESVQAFPGVQNQQNTYVLNDYLSNVVWRYSLLDGGWSAEVQFGDHDPERWRDLILSLSGINASMRARMVVAGSEQITDWVPVHVDASTLRVEANALSGKVALLDARHQMQRRTRRRAWVGQTPEDIISAIAAEHALDADVGELSNQAGDKWQCGISDWDFLRGSVLPDLHEGSRGDVHLWVDGGTLRARTIDLGARPTRFFGVNAHKDSRVSSFDVVARPHRVNVRGGGTARNVTLIEREKRYSVYEIGAEERSQIPAMAQKLAVPADDYLTHIAAFKSSTDRLEGSGAFRWASHAQLTLFAYLTIQADLLVKVGDIVQIAADLPGKVGPFNGRYAVVEVQHTLSPTLTTLTLARRETSYGVTAAESAVAASNESADNYPDRLTTTSVVRKTVSQL